MREYGEDRSGAGAGAGKVYVCRYLVDDHDSGEDLFDPSSLWEWLDESMDDLFIPKKVLVLPSPVSSLASLIECRS